MLRKQSHSTLFAGHQAKGAGCQAAEALAHLKQPAVDEVDIVGEVGEILDHLYGLVDRDENREQFTSTLTMLAHGRTVIHSSYEKLDKVRKEGIKTAIGMLIDFCDNKALYISDMQLFADSFINIPVTSATFATLDKLQNWLWELHNKTANHPKLHGMKDEEGLVKPYKLVHGVPHFKITDFNDKVFHRFTGMAKIQMVTYYGRASLNIRAALSQYLEQQARQRIMPSC